MTPSIPGAKITKDTQNIASFSIHFSSNSSLCLQYGATGKPFIHVEPEPSYRQCLPTSITFFLFRLCRLRNGPKGVMHTDRLLL